MAFHPFGPDNEKITRSWHSEPPYRGTYGILSTCLITMTLCIWTAVHLNMGIQHKVAAQYGRKILWLIVGLFAPELIAWTAFQQYQEASHLSEEFQQNSSQMRCKWLSFRRLRRLLTVKKSVLSTAEEKGPFIPVTPRRYAWTLTHSHFALMGGFAVDLGFLHQDDSEHNACRKVLSPEAIKQLIHSKPDLIPDVSVDNIHDKSKASSLAKTIVCLQAFWFCAQCINRLAQNLSISLLELNTFAHALCALLVYFLWWHKPLDVDEPILVDVASVDAREIVAMWVMQEYYDVRQEYYDMRVGFDAHPVSKVPKPSDWIALDFNLESAREKIDLAGTRLREQEQRPVTLYPISSFIPALKHDKSAEKYILTNQSQLYHFTVLSRLSDTDVGIALTEKSVALLKLASAGYLGPNAPLGWSRPSRQPYLVDRARDWPRLGTIDSYGIILHDNTILAAFSLAGLLYGMIHLAAWNAPFPSAVERVFWRGAAIILISSPIFLSFGVVGRDWGIWAASLALSVVVPAGLCYVAARIYLVVECFISLFYLPAEAYLVPSWSHYFPHIA